MLTFAVQKTPTHIVVWNDDSHSHHNKHHNDNNLHREEIQILKERIETLERLVQSLLDQNNKVSNTNTFFMNKAKASPFFKSTNVTEPIGLEVMNFNLDNESLPTESEHSSICESQIFHNVVEKASHTEGTINTSHQVSKKVKEVNEKQVVLNGMNFIVRNWGNDIIYCDEITGRAFIDPNDAFNDPTKFYIGYWDEKQGKIIEREDSISIESDSIKKEKDMKKEVEIEEEQKKETHISVVKEDVKGNIIEEINTNNKDNDIPANDVIVDNQDDNEDNQEDEENEDEDEEGGIELEEFEYKGVTYYKDQDSIVYQNNEEGEPDVENPIGIWDEVKQKIKKYSK